MESNARHNILIVDDSVEHLFLLHNLLRREYGTMVARSGERGIDIATATPRPDLILLDLHMPGLSGYDTCRQLKQTKTTADIPVIFVTADGTEANEEQGLTFGAVDYITKPFAPAVVRARVRTHLALKDATDRLRRQTQYLEEEVRRRTAQIERAHEVTIRAIASVVEARDDETGGHVMRTQHYMRLLAEALQEDTAFASVLSADYVDLLFKTAPLHDIGKVGIPDEILRKAGRLTPEEFETVKLHTVIGHDALVRVSEAEGADLPFLRMAKDLTLSHHERWNGTGYPHGLVGTDIPLSARLMAIADTYDALRSNRCYRSAVPHQEVVHIIAAESGRHFDPAAVAAFLRVAEAFDEISRRFPDA